jgi:putative membrane protein
VSVPTAPSPATAVVPPKAVPAGAAFGGVALGLAVATVAVQIACPLLGGEALRTATIAAVLLFAAASVAHAAARYGPPGAARLLAVAGGAGFLAEAAGVATGVPFGTYHYAGSLGPELLGVPLVVPLAWAMMAYPCLLLGRRLGRRRVARVALAAWTLAAWDLCLDPQMVADGHWAWSHPAPALPGVPGIPLTNFAGWLLVATVIVLLLDRALPGSARPVAPVAPALLLGWTWTGSALGNLVFFGRPAVAAYGGVALGVTVAPYLWSLRRGQA